MKNKKYLALLIAAGMVMSMTACGGAGQTQESGSAAENESSSGSEAQIHPVGRHLVMREQQTTER